jgi:hypothetical protein
VSEKKRDKEEEEKIREGKSNNKRQRR